MEVAEAAFSFSHSYRTYRGSVTTRALFVNPLTDFYTCQIKYLEQDLVYNMVIDGVGSWPKGLPIIGNFSDYTTVLP